MFAIIYVTPQPEGIDTVRAVIRGAGHDNPLIGAAFDSYVDYTSIATSCEGKWSVQVRAASSQKLVNRPLCGASSVLRAGGSRVNGMKGRPALRGGAGAFMFSQGFTLGYFRSSSGRVKRSQRSWPSCYPRSEIETWGTPIGRAGAANGIRGFVVPNAKELRITCPCGTPPREPRFLADAKRECGINFQVLLAGVDDVPEEREPSSETKSEPSGATATPTGRPQTSPSAPPTVKPVRKSSHSRWRGRCAWAGA